MKLQDLFSLEELAEKIDEGFVVKREHPSLDLSILNYTAKTQFDWKFDAVTMACRGLIVDSEQNVVARPFEKFFSYEQLNGEVPKESFEVYEKLDGSLLIVTVYRGNIVVSTRGSFESEQAKEGEKILRDKYSDFEFEEGLTYLFEVIYPANRIVVDYEGMRDVVLLAVVGNESGEYVEIQHPFRVPEKFEFSDLSEVLKDEKENFEGYILRFESGTLVKIKMEEYKRLHRLITGVSEKTVWEALKDNRIEELIEGTPDEFYDFVKRVEADLLSQYEEIEQSCKKAFWEADLHLGISRKEVAEQFLKHKYPAVLFHMYDGKKWDYLIWKFIQPEVKEVFKMVGGE